MNEANNYRFELVYDVISDIVFEHIPFDENTGKNVAKYEVLTC